MNDQVHVTGLKVMGICGCLPHERVEAQPFRVDLIVSLNLDQAAQTDDLNDTVNYALLADAAANLVATSACFLVEALADRIGRACLALDARITEATVKVTKLQPPIPYDVEGVGVTRTCTR
ncbi:MAG: dihydroneopterin aldolase [Actinomycetota bacterium]